MNYVFLLGRILFTAIFIMSGIGHFSPQTIQYAGAAGVPWAHFLVPFSGVIALLAGISILIGYKTRIGAWLVVIFLVPVTFVMHKFWGISDPVTAGIQQAMFMKNFALIGAALMFAYYGSGPLSIDSDKKAE